MYVCIRSEESCHAPLEVPLEVGYGLAVGRNDYRDGLKQRNLVYDRGLDDRVRAMAVACGVSVNQFIVGVLEREVASGGSGGVVPGDAGDSQAGQRGSGAERGRVGSGAVGVGAGDVEQPRVSPDWDAIMAVGRQAKVVYPVDTMVVDPLEEIA